MSVTIEGNLARVQFTDFDVRNDYEMFLRCKKLPEAQVSYDWRTSTYEVTTPARFAPLLGVEVDAGPVKDPALANHLFDYQRWIVQTALDAKRFAIWADTGLGKTAMFLEWARQVHDRTGGRVLILSPLNIIEQTCDEHERFYGDAGILTLSTREALEAFCAGRAPFDAGPSLAICNYEKLIPGQISELRHLAGVVCDESSLLKTGGGKIKWNLIHSAKGIEYKLSCTATPAPNDTMEYASQASFLEKLRNDGDILWTYFTRDKRGNWLVKPHAKEAFYRFMSSWSIYLRDPAVYGFEDILSTLPPPEIHEHRLEMTEEQRGWMQHLLTESGRGLFDERLGVRERSKLSQIAKGFLYGSKPMVRLNSFKPHVVADLTRDEVAAGRQTLVWTVFDEESKIVETELEARGVEFLSLHGETRERDRAEHIAAFKRGDVPVLISKASMIGYGLNFQNAQAMVFSGFDDSFERMYQSIRRAYRFGQTHTVHVHVPVIPELEGLMLENLKSKERKFEHDVAVQEANYRRALEAGQ